MHVLISDGPAHPQGTWTSYHTQTSPFARHAPGLSVFVPASHSEPPTYQQGLDGQRKGILVKVAVERNEGKSIDHPSLRASWLFDARVFSSGDAVLPKTAASGQAMEWAHRCNLCKQSYQQGRRKGWHKWRLWPRFPCRSQPHTGHRG